MTMKLNKEIVAVVVAALMLVGGLPVVEERVYEWK